jgi:hypothetical protein
MSGYFQESHAIEQGRPIVLMSPFPLPLDDPRWENGSHQQPGLPSDALMHGQVKQVTAPPDA